MTLEVKYDKLYNPLSVIRYPLSVIRSFFFNFQLKIILPIFILILASTLTSCSRPDSGDGPQFFDKVTCVSAGSFYTMAVKEDGSLWAWGWNEERVFGNDTNTDSEYPLRIGIDTNWKIIFAGRSAITTASKTDGSIWRWGGFPRLEVTTDWKKISTSGEHTMIIKDNGDLYAWGANANGQLGDGSVISNSSPVKIGTDTWKAVSAEYVNNTVAINDNGDLYAWGYTFGDVSNRPVPILPGTKWLEVSAGRFYAMAIKDNGTLWAWGINDYGQLGNGEGGYEDDGGGGTTPKFSSDPVQIGKDTDWKIVSAGQYHSAAIKKDGSLYTWGRNNYGQLGKGTSGDLDNPANLKPAKIDGKWKAVSLGISHTVAIRSDGVLWAWGKNDKGQVGDGTTRQRNKPVRVAQETDY